VLAESLAEDVLVGLEGDVTDEKGVGLWVLGVTELGSTLGGALPWRSVVTWSREVDVGLAAIDQSTLLGGKSLGGIGSVGKLDVTETLGAARLTVRDDAGASDLTELLELAVQPLVIDVPGQVADEEVLWAILGSGLSLGLLGGGLLLVIGLALLAWLLLLGRLLLGIGRVRVRRVLGLLLLRSLLLRVGRIGIGRLL
jgi:hypothetical protein